MEKTERVEIRYMPIDQYLNQVDADVKTNVLELVYKMELGSGMIAEDMELVVNQLDQDSISIVSLTLNPHLRA